MKQYTTRNGKIYTNRHIYNLCYDAMPTWKNSTYNNAYIKILAAVAANGGQKMDLYLKRIYGYVKNFDTFKTLVNFGFIEQVDPTVRRHMKFRITQDGLDLLEEAAYSKPVYDLIAFQEKEKAENEDILSLHLTLAGKAYMNEPEFINNVKQLIADHPAMERHLRKAIPFIDKFFESMK